MNIHITKREDPIKLAYIISLIYGEPGSGKTSLGFSTNKPLLLDFDRGAHRSAFRGDTVQVESWDQVANLQASDFKGYKTVVVDTVGRQLDLITADLAASDPKLTRRTGELSLQGYGALKAVFTAWIHRLQTFGLDIVLLSHAREDKRAGDEVVQRPDIQGGSYAEVLKVTDMVGFLYRSQGGPMLDFSPTDTHIGKNAPGFEPLVVADLHQDPTFLGNIIKDAKNIINTRNNASQEVADKVAEVRELVEASQSADEVNDLVLNHITNGSNGKSEAAQIGKLVKQHAKDIGLVYDKKAGGFIQPEQSDAAA